MKEIRKKEEVERFLKQFLPKLDIWGIIYIDREKNDAALKAMGITPNAREPSSGVLKQTIMLKQ